MCECEKGERAGRENVARRKNVVMRASKLGEEKASEEESK
jgi:hypothetical protein